jgi:transcriptional regulator with XRE-family HTH domain
MQGTPTPGSVGARIAAAREAAELRPEAIAAALNVSVATLGRYERGETPVSYLAVCVIAAKTGKPVDWFMTVDPEPAEAVA